MVAIVLMDRLRLDPAERALFERIAAGEKVDEQALLTLRRRADELVNELRRRGDLPDGY